MNTQRDLYCLVHNKAFDVLVTTDTNPKYRQNLSHRALAIIELTNTSWRRIRTGIAAVPQAMRAPTPGSNEEVEIP